MGWAGGWENGVRRHEDKDLEPNLKAHYLEVPFILSDKTSLLFTQTKAKLVVRFCLSGNWEERGVAGSPQHWHSPGMALHVMKAYFSHLCGSPQY